MTWIAVTRRLPEAGRLVIVSVAGCHDLTHSCLILRAQYAPAKTLEVSPEADGGIYDEETDTFYCEEGWYETNEYEEVHWNVDGEVTHWMLLPEPPCATCESGADASA